MKALNQKGRSPIVIDMVQTDWNEALNRPSSTISIVALMLGIWVVLLSIVNLVEGAYSPGYKVSWFGFLGLGEEAFTAHDYKFTLDDGFFISLGLLFIAGGDRGMKKASPDSEGALAFITGLPSSNFANNLVKGEKITDIISSWLVVIGILFYLIWSIQNNTWVDPGVYAVTISMVAFGLALGMNSDNEN